jgi:N4-gp56 family major capsid protein
MAYMNVSTVTDLADQIPEIWQRKLFMSAQAMMWWQKFTGAEGSGMPVVVKRDLIDQPGDTIHVNRLIDLSGAGVTGESTLEGNEEKISDQQVVCVPDWIRHGVAATGKAKKQINNDFREMAMRLLSRWIAKKQDQDKWTAAQTVAACGYDNETIGVVYPGNKTSVDTLDSADEFTVAEIRKTAALMRGDDIPGVMVPDLPGEQYYICLIHPYQGYTLKQDTEWINAQRDSAIRGKANPLFTGALGEVDGVVLYETTNATLVANANSPSINTARAVMMGAEAMAHAENKVLTWAEQKRDYGFEHGIGIEIAYQNKVLYAKALRQIVTAAIAPS